MGVQYSWVLYLRFSIFQVNLFVFIIGVIIYLVEFRVRFQNLNLESFFVYEIRYMYICMYCIYVCIDKVYKKIKQLCIFKEFIKVLGIVLYIICLILI